LPNKKIKKKKKKKKPPTKKKPEPPRKPDSSIIEERLKCANLNKTLIWDPARNYCQRRSASKSEDLVPREHSEILKETYGSGRRGQGNAEKIKIKSEGPPTEISGREGA